jgi:hypothetical protein
MRLARLVAAGLVLGVVVGFVTALVRPRGRHPVPTHRPQNDRRPEPQHDSGPDADHVAPHPPVSEQVGPAGAGADLPTRPIPLPTWSALSGSGGSH